MTRLRLGIVGLGTVAQAVYLPLLARRPDLFALASLYDVSPSTLAATVNRYGGEPRRSFTEVLADAPDGLLLLTAGSHGADALAAAEAGIPVLCEKPLAYTLAEADALAGAGATLQLGYMKLYDPAVERAVAAMEGRPAPRSVDVTVLHPPAAPQLAHIRLSAPVADVPAEVHERLEAETAATLVHALGDAPPDLSRLYSGVLLASVVHELAVVRALAGDPVSIEGAHSWPDDRYPGSFSIDGTLSGGGRLSIRWHYLEQATVYREEIRVHDDLGTVELVFPSPYLLHTPTVFSETGSTTHGGEETRGFRSTAEAFERQLEAFHRFVAQGERPRAGVAEGRADIATCQRVARRLAEGRGWAIGGEAAA